jgi:hypothetical protein
MGRERYAWRFKTETEFAPALFKKRRFCLEYSPEDSHHTLLQPYYAELYARFDQCLYVGDKLPNLYRRYRYVLETFPNCHIIYMARNVFDVAASFDRRARQSARKLESDPTADPARLWPVDRDWRRAVEEWNESVVQTSAVSESTKLLVVDYDRLYADQALLEKLLAFLGLDPVPELMDAWSAGGEQKRRIEATRELPFDEEQLRIIRETAHLQKFQELLLRSA